MNAFYFLAAFIPAYLYLVSIERRTISKPYHCTPMMDDEKPANLVALSCLAIAGVAMLFTAIRLTIYLITGS